ncbi:MAG: type I restriction enzyme HsdR N-terminal domain-containing protein [Owenweeksia sp.]|nr:type I restriction enzyme HsdR N-terminal domain-containing protein [Owenweeksia sp.]
MHFLAGRDYPTSAMALEGGFYLHKKLQRSDILVYKNAQPTLLVECKSPQVKISQNTFDQASRYNLKIKAPYVAVTNGLKHFIAMADHAARRYRFLEDVPAFGEL